MRSFLVILSLFYCALLFSQQDPFVFKPFIAPALIHSQTSEIVPLGAFELVIEHKFGKADVSENFIHDFVGMDLAANIRFAFLIPITQNIYVGLGRSKEQKTYDFEAKYRVLRQTIDNKMPVSLAFYADVACSTADFPKVTDNYYFSDGKTPFAYTFNHRISYEMCISVNRKLTRWLTVQLAPTWIHHNLVNPNQNNDIYMLPVGAAFKTGMFSSLLLEYAQNLTNSETNHIQYALAYQIETSTHTFNMHLSTNGSILNQNYYLAKKEASITDGQFYFGFAINKRFWSKKKKK